MEPIVTRAMAKWPNVPAVFGWLKLDRRGQWWIRIAAPEGAQETAPRFEPVRNRRLIEFIGRNYGHDDAGRWYFQNGPQRVYVELDYTPFVYRIARLDPLAFETHTGAPGASLRAVWMDEAGNLLLLTECGPGLLLDRDLPRGLEALSDADGHALGEERVLALIDEGEDAAGVQFNTAAGSLPLSLMRSEEAPARLGFEREPRPDR